MSRLSPGIGWLAITTLYAAAARAAPTGALLASVVSGSSATATAAAATAASAKAASAASATAVSANAASAASATAASANAASAAAATAASANAASAKAVSTTALPPPVITASPVSARTISASLMAASAEPALDEPTSVGRERIAWNEAWPRFRTAEAIVTGAMLLPIAGALFLYPNPDDNLHGGVLFDDAVRDAIVLDDKSGRSRAASLSNLPYFGLLAFPLLVDTALVAGAVHRSGDVALEMLAMNLESFAITGAISLSFQKLGRVRPSEKGCASDPDYASKCDDPVALNQSFLSGHTSVAFTGAGLTCVHHRHLPLYGGGWPDLAICATALAAASATGVLRVMSDNHYASDVLLGVGVGLASGWLLPESLHYGAGDEVAATGQGETRGRRSGGLLPTFGGEGWRALIAPQITGGSLGLALIARH